MDDQLADTDGGSFEIGRIGGNHQPCCTILSLCAFFGTEHTMQRREFLLQAIEAIRGGGDPDTVHLRFVVTLPKEQQQLLTVIYGEHAEEGLYDRLDRQEIIEDEIERYFAVHGTNVRKNRASAQPQPTAAAPDVLPAEATDCRA